MQRNISFGCHYQMKRNFLGIFFMLICFSYVNSGCKKSHDFKSPGVIVGWNEGYCVVCGGFYLNLSTDTTINAHTYYVLNYAPQSSSVINELYTGYHKNPRPLNVFVDWQNVSDSFFLHPALFITGIKAAP